MSYLVRRLLQMIIVVIGVTIIVFFILRLIPGTPCAVMLGQYVRPETIEKCKTDQGFNKPVWIQYGAYVSRVLRGDLGRSLYYRRPAMEVFLERVPATVFLALYSIIISILISTPLGIIAALNRGGIIESIIRILTTISLSMPAFWIGLLLILFFSVRLPIFPFGGFGSTFAEHLLYLFLPALTIALTMSTVLARTLRNSILEILQSDYVRTARAKGLSWNLVVLRHVLRNALISYVTLLGINLAWVIGGTVIIEQVFGIPGIGSLLISSILNRDYDLVQNNILIYALFVVTINLLVDLIYPILDPRVRHA